MKFKSLLLLFCLSLFVVACSEDDDDDVPTNQNANTCTPNNDLESNIIGSWTSNPCTGNDPVVFNSDSTFQDPAGCLLSINGNPNAESTYEIRNDSLALSVSDSSGGASIVFPVTENCNERIRLSFIGIPITLQRN